VATSSICSYVSPLHIRLLSNDTPHHSLLVVGMGTCHRRQGVGRLDQCSLFAMICWTLSLAFLLCRAFIFTPSFSLSLHCAVTLNFPTMFSLSLLYLPSFIPSRIILTSFRKCFPNHILPLSLSGRIIPVSYLCRSSSFSYPSRQSRNIIRYQVVHMFFSDGDQDTVIYCTENIVPWIVCSSSHGSAGWCPIW